MSDALSREALLEYVKKQKQKIKKLEHELSEEREKSDANAKISNIPDLSALQDEISGGISAFFGIIAPSAPTEAVAHKNDGPAAEHISNSTISKDEELAASAMRERKLKLIIKTKMKENDEKDKEIQQYQLLLANIKDDTDNSTQRNFSQQQNANIQNQMPSENHECIKEDSEAVRVCEGINEDLQGQLSSYNTYIAQLELTVKDLESKLVLAAEDLRVFSEEALIKIESLNLQVTNGSAMVRDLNATVTATKAEIDGLNKRLIEEEEGRKVLESSCEAAVKIEKGRAEVFEKKCIHMSEELIAIRDKKESLVGALAEESAEKEELKQTISLLEKEREERIIEMSATEEEYRKQLEIHAQHESAANEQESVRVKDLTEQLSVSQSKLDVMRSEIETKISSMTERHDTIVAELRATLSSQMEESAEKEELKQTISLLEKEREERIIEMSATEEEYRKQLEIHAQHESAANEQESVRVKDLTEQLSVSQSKLDVMRGEIETKISSMTDKHDIMIAELESAHASQMEEGTQKMVEMKDKVKAKMSEIRDQNSNRIAELSSELDRLYAVDKDSVEKITTLEKLLASKTESASNRSKELSIEVDALKAENLSLQQNITHLISTNKCISEVQSSVDERSVVGVSASEVERVDEGGGKDVEGTLDITGDVITRKVGPFTGNLSVEAEGDAEKDVAKIASENLEEKTGSDVADKGKGREREKGGKKKGGKGNKGAVNEYVAVKDVERNVEEDLLKSLVSKLEEDLKCSKDQLASMQSQLDANGDQAETAATLRTLLNDKEDEISQLVGDKEKATSESERDSLKALQYETSLKNLQEHFDKMKLTFEADIASNIDTIEQREIQLKEREVEVLRVKENCEAEVRSALEQMQAEAEIANTLRQKRDSLTEKVSHLDEQLTKCYTDLDHMKEEMKASSEGDELKRHNADLQMQHLQDLRSELAALQQAYNAEQEARRNTDATMESANAIAALESDRRDAVESELKAVLSEKDKLLEEREQELLIAATRAHDLQALVDQKQSDVLRLEDLLHAEEAKVKAHVENISALKDAALLAATETEQLRGRLTELQDQPVVPLYDPHRDALDAAITESEDAVRSLKEELRVTLEELRSVHSRIDIMKENEIKISEERESLMGEIRKLEEQSKKVESHFNEKLIEANQAKDNLQIELDELKVLHNEGKSVFEEREVEFQKEKKKILTDKVKLQNALKLLKSSTEKRDLDHENEKEIITIERKKADEELMKIENEKVSQCDKLEREKESLIQERDNLINEISKLNNIISTAQSEYEKTRMDMQKDNVAVQREKDNLLVLLQTSQSDLQAAQKQREDIASECESRLADTANDLKVRKSNFELEMSNCRVEGEHLRKRVLELEGVVEGIEMAAASDLEAEKRAEELYNQLEEQRTLVAEFSTKHSQALADLTALRQDSEAKIEVFSEKCKRLKALLAKSKQMAGEKEAEMNKLMSTGGRPKRFSIQCRVMVSVDGRSSEGGREHGNEMWCLVLEDVAPWGVPVYRGIGNRPGLQWDLESLVRTWETEGSSMIGPWPEPLQDKWDRDLRTLRFQLEEENSKVRGELEEITSNFNSYKIRAQTALKRIGADDKASKVKSEEERGQLEELQETVKTLETQVEELSRDLETERVRVQQQCVEIKAIQESLNSKVEDSEAIVDQEQAMRTTLKSQINALQQEIAEMKRNNDAVGSDDEGDFVRIGSVEESLEAQGEGGGKQSERRTHGSDSRVQVLTSSKNLNPGPASPRKETSALEIEGADKEGTVDVDIEVDMGALMNHKGAERKRKNAISGGIGGILQQKTEEEQRENILTLRTENSYLTGEINDFRHRVALNEEQISSLKTSIRDLEMSLVREREFNSSTSEVNVEYLVNVLRKFLMTNNLSERAKLVTVLCSILHLRGEDAKVIAEKWAVKGGGIVGWLIPNRPQQGSSALMDDDYRPQSGIVSGGSGSGSSGREDEGVGNVSASSQFM